MNSVERAIEAAGGIRALSLKCDVSYEAVRKWRAQQHIPVNRVLLVERISGVPRHELRPDIYPPGLA